MSESFEQLLNESFKTIRTGEVVKGTVIAVKENEIELLGWECFRMICT